MIIYHRKQNNYFLIKHKVSWGVKRHPGCVNGCPGVNSMCDAASDGGGSNEKDKQLSILESFSFENFSLKLRYDRFLTEYFGKARLSYALKRK